MDTEITIHSYAHNGVEGSLPRQPVVHLLASGNWGDVSSIAFHPDDAPAIAKAILAAGRAAKAGRRKAAVKIELKPHG